MPLSLVLVSYNKALFTEKFTEMPPTCHLQMQQTWVWLVAALSKLV